MERFNGYLKRSFITPLLATLKQAGLQLDVHLANGQIGLWLHDVANDRIHATTDSKPQSLLEQERFSLRPLPQRSTRLPDMPAINARRAVPVESLQHPLSVYDRLLETRL